MKQKGSDVKDSSFFFKVVYACLGFEVCKKCVYVGCCAASTLCWRNVVVV